MKHLILPVKRAFNWKAYLTLLGLLIPAVFAIQPYVLTTTHTPNPGFWNLMLGAGISLLEFALFAAAGLWFATRLGLGMPFIEGWTKQAPSWNRLPGVVGISILAGIVLPLIPAIDAALVALINPSTGAQGGAPNAAVITPPAWQGFLASFSAGVTEEVIFRLFGLTLLVWLGSLVFRSRTSRPTPSLLWAANILFALLFSLAHLNTASQSGITLTPMIVIRTILINGAGGVLFGWLYVSYGLESAMLAHIMADVVMHGFVPLVTLQTDLTWRMITSAVFGVMWVITIFWSVRAIRRDQKQFPPSNDSGVASLGTSLSNPASSGQRE